MTRWWHEIRRTARTLRRRPASTTVALATLAIGIGATTAIWSLVDAVLVDPLAYPDPDRIVTVWEDLEAFGGPSDEWTSEVVARTWREAAGAQAVVAAWDDWRPTLSGDGEPTRLTGQVASDGYFEVFGVAPALGRIFREDEERVAVLSDGLWRRLGADPGILDSPLWLDGESWRVVGVLPEGFRSPSPVDLWGPLPLPADAADFGEAYRRVVARLAPGVAAAQLEDRLEAATAELVARHPGAMDPVGVTVIPLEERLVGSVRPVLLALLAAAGLVLLVASVNVAAVQVARATERRRELALRAALGASRTRLAGHLLLESLVLGVVGGGGGALLGLWGGEALAGMASTFSPLVSGLVDPSPPVGSLLGFVAFAALAAGLVAGLPALAVGAGADPSPGLRSGDERSGRARSRLQPALVVLQLGLALALAVGATLLARSLAELLRVDPGFRADAVVTADLSLPAAAYERADRAPFFRRLVERLEARGEVAAAGVVSAVPLDGGGDSDVTVAVEGTAPEEDAAAWYRVIDPGVVGALRIPIRAGRIPAADEGRIEGPPVLVNETFARTRLAGRDPLTARILIGGRGAERGWSPVAGVLADVREQALGESPRGRIFLLHEDFPVSAVTVVVRATSAAAVDGALRALREETTALDPALPLDRVRTMDGRVADAVAVPRLAARLFAAFAAIALFLAAVGIYGMLAVHVAARRREIGIRMSLGADRGTIRRDVLGRALGLAAAGLGVGVLIAIPVGRGLGALLYGVSSADPVSWIGPTAALAVVALVAAARPTALASRVDPARVLREE